MVRDLGLLGGERLDRQIGGERLLGEVGLEAHQPDVLGVEAGERHAEVVDLAAGEHGGIGLAGAGRAHHLRRARGVAGEIAGAGRAGLLVFERAREEVDDDGRLVERVEARLDDRHGGEQPARLGVGREEGPPAVGGELLRAHVGVVGGALVEVPGQIFAGDRRAGEALDPAAPLGDDEERERDALLRARGEHAHREGGERALGDDAKRLDLLDALAGGEARGDEVEALRGVVVEDRLHVGGDGVAVHVEPVAERARRRRGEGDGLVGAHGLAVDHLDRRVLRPGDLAGGVAVEGPGRAAASAAALERAAAAVAEGLGGRDERGGGGVERLEPGVGADSDRRAGLDRHHPGKVLGVALILDLIPEHCLLGRDADGHAVTGHRRGLGLGRRDEHTAAASARGRRGEREGE